jgi:hypothetical protein
VEIKTSKEKTCIFVIKKKKNWKKDTVKTSDKISLMAQKRKQGTYR